MSSAANPDTGRSLEPAPKPAALLERRTCTPPEFARAIGTGANRVRQLVKDGHVRAVHHGRRIVIPLSEIDRFLEAQAQGGK